MSTSLHQSTIYLHNLYFIFTLTIYIFSSIFSNWYLCSWQPFIPKSDWFVKVKLTADLKKEIYILLLLTWARNGFLNFNTAKTKLLFFNHLRELFLPFISIADANLQEGHSLHLFKLIFSTRMK